jgi:hypothetical protein
VRVGGNLAPNTTAIDTKQVSAKFTLTDGAIMQPVDYKGILPDTFEKSTQVIAEGKLAASPVQPIAAVSLGVVGGRPVLDLDYLEDSAASVDMNLVMNGRRPRNPANQRRKTRPKKLIRGNWSL